MAPPVRSASRRTIVDDVRWFTYDFVPKTAMVILVIHITLTLIYTFQYRQSFPSAGAIAITALFGSFLVLFAVGCIILRFSDNRAPRPGDADVEGSDAGVGRFSISVDDSVIQSPPNRMAPLQVQHNAGPAAAQREVEGAPEPVPNGNNQPRQHLIQILQDINGGDYHPSGSRNSVGTPRQARQLASQQNVHQSDVSPPNRQAGERPMVITNPDPGQSSFVPPRRHPGRLSTDTERRIPSPIPEHPAEHDSNGRGNQRYSMPQGPNDLWPPERHDGTVSRAGNRPADETTPGRRTGQPGPDVQRPPPSPIVNPNGQNNPSVNLAQLDHEDQAAQERMALVLSLIDLKDPAGFLHHLETMARNLPRQSGPGATEVEQDNASDTSDGSVYSHSCGFSRRRIRKRTESWATDISEEDVERLNYFGGFEPSVDSDSFDYNYSEYSDNSTESSRARYFTRPSSPCNSDHSGGVYTRFDRHNNYNNYNNNHPPRQGNKDYHYACPSTAVANRLIDLLDRMFDLLEEAKAHPDQDPGATREVEPSVFEGVGTGEAYGLHNFTDDQSKADHNPAASSLSPRVLDAIARYLERYPATETEIVDQLSKQEEPMVFLRRSGVRQPASRFLRETGWVLVWKGGYWETNERVIELDEDDEVEVEMMDDDVEVEMMDDDVEVEIMDDDVEVEIIDGDVEVEMMDEECDHEGGDWDGNTGARTLSREDKEHEEE